jgi:hypothetical protein
MAEEDQMPDVEAEGSMVDEDEENENSNSTTEELTNWTADTIANSLNRKRQPTRTLLEETSQANLVSAGTTPKRSRLTNSSPLAPGGVVADDEESKEQPGAAETVPTVEVESAADIGYLEDFLPKFKVKATQECMPVPEIVKLANHRDLAAGNAGSFGPFCENLFTVICCLVVDRVTTSGQTMTADEQLELYNQYYYEQCQTCTLDSYLQENLFAHVPNAFERGAEGNLTWPGFFTTYVRETYMQKPLTGYQTNRGRNLQKMSRENGMKYNFSLAIKAAAREAMTEINNRYAMHHYVHVL